MTGKSAPDHATATVLACSDNDGIFFHGPENGELCRCDNSPVWRSCPTGRSSGKGTSDFFGPRRCERAGTNSSFVDDRDRSGLITRLRTVVPCGLRAKCEDWSDSTCGSVTRSSQNWLPGSFPGSMAGLLDQQVRMRMALRRRPPGFWRSAKKEGFLLAATGTLQGLAVRFRRIRFSGSETHSHLSYRRHGQVLLRNRGTPAQRPQSSKSDLRLPRVCGREIPGHPTGGWKTGNRSGSRDSPFQRRRQT